MAQNDSMEPSSIPDGSVAAEGGNRSHGDWSLGSLNQFSQHHSELAMSPRSGFAEALVPRDAPQFDAEDFLRDYEMESEEQAADVPPRVSPEPRRRDSASTVSRMLRK